MDYSNHVITTESNCLKLTESDLMELMQSKV